MLRFCMRRFFFRTMDSYLLYLHFYFQMHVADKKIPFTFKQCSDIKKGLCHDLFDVSFPTDQDGWACGRWGTILHTEDSGKTWVRQPCGTDYTLSAVYFVDQHTGVAVGDEGNHYQKPQMAEKHGQGRRAPCPIF